MKEYHKIQTVFMRDPASKHKTLLEGQYSLSEFEYLANNQWVFTEKIDGTNIRVMFDESMRVTYGGKTNNAQIPTKLLARLQDQFSPALFASTFSDSKICLYGEGYGAGIQSGGIYRPDQNFILFDVQVGEWWLRRADVEDVALKMGLEVVPIVGKGTLINMVDLVKNSKFESAWNRAKPEGIVARPEVELRTRSGERLITKLKFKDFSNGSHQNP